MVRIGCSRLDPKFTESIQLVASKNRAQRPRRTRQVRCPPDGRRSVKRREAVGDGRPRVDIRQPGMDGFTREFEGLLGNITARS